MAKIKTTPKAQDMQNENLQPEIVDEKPSTPKAQDLPASGVVTIEHLIDNRKMGFVKGKVVSDVSVECARVMIDKGVAKLVN